jgi:hypothetical protein
MAPGGDASLAAAAQASSVTYSDFAGGRPVDLFAAAVRAGANATSPAAWSPAAVLDGLDAYLARFQGANFMPFAPGGGIENIGIARALCDMLVDARRLPPAAAGGAGAPAPFAIALFPFWPADEPAAFAGLLTKGGVVVGARYDNGTRAVASPVALTAAHTLAGAPAARVTLSNPWPAAPLARLAASCAGAPVPLDATPDLGLVSFDAPASAACELALLEAAAAGVAGA